jgi:hypothetical protein
MDSIQISKNSRYSTVQWVYSIIQRESGKVTAKHLEKEIGNKYGVHYAITRLTKEGKIKRVRGFGPQRIEFFYLDVSTQAG